MKRTLFVTVACILLAATGVASCSKPASNAAAEAAPSVPSVTEPSKQRVRLITGEQYANTLGYVFGSDIELGAPLAPLRRTDGLLASGAATAGVTTGQLQELQRAAAAIAAQVLDAGNLGRLTAARRDYFVPCKPKSASAPDDACAAQFIRTTGRLLFRRPLGDDKLAPLVNEANKGAAKLNDFYAGLSVVLESMLINPQVLLIEDTTEPDPQHPGRQRLDAYALASRLSFFLWAAAPDDALLDAAESGELLTAKGRERAVERMLASPRAQQGLKAFFDDMFAFDDFNSLSKDPSAYPSVTGVTLKDAREQTLRTAVDHLLVQKRDYRDLYTTRQTFISPALAALYQTPTRPGWTPYEFSEASGRAGILTHISFLAVHAHPARSSPTLRGKALRELILCQKVPPPPPNVDFSAVENPAANLRTARQRLTEHSQNPVCAGCHRITDPIGLVLENFDGAGQYRATERGAAIDTSGELDGKKFSTVAELGSVLRDHPALPTCLVRRLYSYGTGGPLSNTDNPNVATFSKQFAAAGYQVTELLRAIALSDAFAVVAPPVTAVAAGSTSLH